MDKDGFVNFLKEVYFYFAIFIKYTNFIYIVFFLLIAILLLSFFFLYPEYKPNFSEVC